MCGTGLAVLPSPGPGATRAVGVDAPLSATTHEPHHRGSCHAMSNLVDTVPHHACVYLPATVTLSDAMLILGRSPARNVGEAHSRGHR